MKHEWKYLQINSKF